MKLDILVFAAHPDDAELGCSGTILKHIAQGKKVGIVDLTRGELGTRGTAQTRDEEAANASQIMAA
jgi:LmbE family N-acetylglucosaminyl deacetylase